MASDFLLTPATRLTLPTLRELLAGNTHVALSAHNAPPTPPIAPTPGSPLWALACGTGAEVPAPLVRLMLLLHAHHQQRHGAPAATVRRLLDFYNREVLPVVYQQGGNQVALAHLSLPLFGLGEVNYQGYRLQTRDVLELFGWEPLPLATAEVETLPESSAFTLAYAVRAWLRAGHLLALADQLAALSLAVVQGLTDPPHADLPALHTGCRAALAYVQQSLEEACNSLPNHLTEYNLLLLPATNAALVMPTLLSTVGELGSRSAQRVELLLHHAAPTLTSLRYPVGSLSRQNQQLRSAALVDGGSSGTEAARSAYEMVDTVEQMLGIELVLATRQLPPQLPPQLTEAAAQLVMAFREQIPAEVEYQPLYPTLHAAARFVREYPG